MIHPVTRSRSVEIQSSLAEVRPSTDAVLEFLRPLRLSDADFFDIRLCLEESLINAIKYGNREKREIPVKLEIAYNDKEIFMAVEDQGSGFDPGAIQDPTEGKGLEAFSGRGVYLIRNLMDRVDYNRKGNRVEMVKVYRKHARV